MRFAALLLFAMPVWAQDAAALADGMLRQLDSVMWSAPYRGGGSCRQYSGSAYGEPLNAVGGWSWHCDRTSAGVVTESYYYAFSDAPRLVRVDIGLAAANGSVRALVETKLTQRFGMPDTGRLPVSYPQPGDLHARISQWHTKDATLLLFDGPFYLSPLRPLAGVRLIALAHPLEDAMRDDAKLGALRYTAGAGNEMEERLAQELGPLVETSTPSVDKLLRLLRAAQTAPDNRRAAMLLAADHMGYRLSDLLGNDRHKAEAESARRQLAPYGVHLGTTFKEGPEYDHATLWEAWRKYPNTPWGEYAFLVLEQSGWDPSFDGYSCPANPDYFRDVVEHGEAFLNSHPDSPYRLQTLFAVATAYETWWSMALVPTGDENYGHYPRRAENDRKSELARMKAIADYERTERLAPKSDYALYARRHLPRLRLKIDTGLRRWFCVGD